MTASAASSLIPHPSSLDFHDFVRVDVPQKPVAFTSGHAGHGLAVEVELFAVGRQSCRRLCAGLVVDDGEMAVFAQKPVDPAFDRKEENIR